MEFRSASVLGFIERSRREANEPPLKARIRTRLDRAKNEKRLVVIPLRRNPDGEEAARPTCGRLVNLHAEPTGHRITAVANDLPVLLLLKAIARDRSRSLRDLERRIR